jgi:hypothetical protein
MDNRKDLLLRSAARLYSLGIEVEGARQKLRSLVEQGIPYDSEEMITAFKNYQNLEEQWKALEKAHLQLLEGIRHIRHN